MEGLGRFQRGKQGQQLAIDHGKQRKAGMKMKYKLYRSFENLDKDIRRHELTAVEIGADIDAVTDALIRAVMDELSGMPEYRGCKVYAYAPKPVDDTRRTKRYQYEMTGVVAPPNAPQNILIDFGIVETAE